MVCGRFIVPGCWEIEPNRAIQSRKKRATKGSRRRRVKKVEERINPKGTTNAILWSTIHPQKVNNNTLIEFSSHLDRNITRSIRTDKLLLWLFAIEGRASTRRYLEIPSFTRHNTRDAAVHRLGVKQDLTWAISCTSKTFEKTLPSIPFAHCFTIFFSCCCRCPYYHHNSPNKIVTIWRSHLWVATCMHLFPRSWSIFCYHHSNEQVTLRYSDSSCILSFETCKFTQLGSKLIQKLAFH